MKHSSSHEGTTTSIAVVAIVAALALLVAMVITVVSISLEAEARGCNRSTPFNASKGRMFPSLVAEENSRHTYACIQTHKKLLPLIFLALAGGLL